MQPEHGCAITGWASGAPEHGCHQQDIMTLFDTSDDWIVERTGIRQGGRPTARSCTPNPPYRRPKAWGRQPKWRPKPVGSA